MLILPPRTSWLYRVCMTLSSSTRYLITCLFIAVCVFIWFYYIYQPLNVCIDSVQQQMHAVQPLPADISEKISALRNELSCKSEILPSDDQLSTVLGYVEHAGMALEHCSVQDKNIYVQATGTYKQCLAFFDQLATSTCALQPRDVRIVQTANNQYSLSVAIVLA